MASIAELIDRGRVNYTVYETGPDGKRRVLGHNRKTYGLPEKPTPKPEDREAEKKAEEEKARAEKKAAEEKKAMADAVESASPDLRTAKEGPGKDGAPAWAKMQSFDNVTTARDAAVNESKKLTASAWLANEWSKGNGGALTIGEHYKGEDRSSVLAKAREYHAESIKTRTEDAKKARDEKNTSLANELTAAIGSAGDAMKSSLKAYEGRVGATRYGGDPTGREFAPTNMQSVDAAYAKAKNDIATTLRTKQRDEITATLLDQRREMYQLDNEDSKARVAEIDQSLRSDTRDVLAASQKQNEEMDAFLKARGITIEGLADQGEKVKKFMGSVTPPAQPPAQPTDNDEKHAIMAEKGGEAASDRFKLARNFLATDKVPDSLFGITIVSRREDYMDRDLEFFARNPEAGGYYDMGEDPGDGGGLEDGEEIPPSEPRIVINPSVFKDEKDALCVAFNEAFRIVMELNSFEPVSEPTPQQREFFADTAYADNELQLRRTILARICTFDTSIS